MSVNFTAPGCSWFLFWTNTSYLREAQLFGVPGSGRSKTWQTDVGHRVRRGNFHLLKILIQAAFCQSTWRFQGAEVFIYTLYKTNDQLVFISAHRSTKNYQVNKLSLLYFKLSCISPSYLCEVLEPRWDAYRNRCSCWNSGRRRGDRCGVVAILRSRHRTRLIHDRGRALIVAHVETWWRGLTGVSVHSWSRWVRCYHVAARLSHGVGCLVVRAWVTWRKANCISSDIMPSCLKPHDIQCESHRGDMIKYLSATNDRSFFLKKRKTCTSNLMQTLFNFLPVNKLIK